jgi:hypothetical protein
MYKMKSLKKWIAPVVAIFGLALGVGGFYGVGYLQGSPEVEGAAAGQALNAPHILQCYNLDEGDLQSERALMTTDNFGRDVVEITQAIMMCEQASKFHPSDANDGRGTVTGSMGDQVLQCYRLRGGSDPDDLVGLRTRNFGDDRVIVRRAVMMCEGARKEHQATPGGDTQSFGTPGDRVLMCYRIQEGDNPQATVVLENRNFGEDKVIVGPAVMMCEEANKRTRTNEEGVGQPTGIVWECYALNEGDDPQATVVLETANFGKDKVIVRHSRMMCERALKDHFSSLGSATPAR